MRYPPLRERNSYDPAHWPRPKAATEAERRASIRRVLGHDLSTYPKVKLLKADNVDRMRPGRTQVRKR